MRFIKGVFIVLASGLMAQSIFSDPLYTFDSVNRTYTDDIPATLGFEFSVKDNFLVTSLGWFDDCLNGFQNEHTVTLFGAGGTVLASLTLPAGTVDPLTGSFRYEAITPVTLTPGITYLLAGTTGDTDPYTENDDICGFTINPRFTIGPDAGRFADNTPPGFFDPDQHYSDYMIYAGPNLDGANVPEPGSLALLGAGGVGLMFLSRIRRNQREESKA
jgi:hypothetical protein